MTAPAYPFDATTLAAIQRLGAAGGVGSYNSNAYDASTNPLGMASGGHRLNFPAAIADIEQVGQALALAAAYTNTQALLATAYAAIVAGQGVSTVFAATNGQTSFAVTYTVGALDVYFNGTLLAPADFTASNGTTVVLGSAAKTGDVVIIRTYTSGYIDNNMVEKTANYTMANRDNIVSRTDTAGGTLAHLLPAAPAQGYECWVANIGGFTTTVGLNGSTGSAAFSGGLYTLAAGSGAAVRFIYTGATWRVKTDGVLT